MVAGERRRGFPLYGWLGLAIIAAGESLLLAGNHWAGVYFTPLQWSGLILCLDGFLKWRRGYSPLSDQTGEFALLLLLSIGSWYIFEAYNLLLKNWTYIGLPDSCALRYLGYFWSFATITPGLLLMYAVLDELIPGGKSPPPLCRMKPRVFWLLVGIGAVCLVVPLLAPSTWMSPLVWIGFMLFMDPINSRLGERSIIAEFLSGHRRAFWLLFLAGLVCGLLWELWNYWAIGKWRYDVPYWGHLKLFEMPVLGFLGFLPFTIECYAIYIFLRRLLPGAGRRRIFR
ncbi:MAG: hypothetical protein ABIF77_03795 [bacterium]